MESAAAAAAAVIQCALFCLHDALHKGEQNFIKILKAR